MYCILSVQFAAVALPQCNFILGTGASYYCRPTLRGKYALIADVGPSVRRPSHDNISVTQSNAINKLQRALLLTSANSRLGAVHILYNAQQGGRVANNLLYTLYEGWGLY